MAGNLSALALATSFSSWAAPSRRLYSEWTCRWTNSACCTRARLLELDGGRRLVGHVVEHGVHALETAQRGGQVIEGGRSEAGEVGGHAVPRVYWPPHDRFPAQGGAQRQQRHPGLPDGVVEPALAHEAGGQERARPPEPHFPPGV